MKFQPWKPLTDDAGNISFTKLVIVTFLVLIAVGKTFSDAMGIAIIAAAFGKSTFEGVIEYKRGRDADAKPPIEP